jgi:hypothetical protein
VTDFQFAGSVSHGTLRVEDLIPTFLDTIEALNPELATAIREDHADTIEHLVTWLEPDPDDLGFLMEILHDTLNRLAPAGYVFSAHEGDGADFGFWVDEEDTVAVAVTFTVVVDVPRVHSNDDVADAVGTYIAEHGLTEWSSIEEVG